MEKRAKTLAASCALAIWWLALPPAQAQNENLEGTIQRLSQDAAREYVAPISSALGANLNGGWFHRAPDPKILGFNLEVGVVGMASFFPRKSTHFLTSGQFIFSLSEAEHLVQAVTDPQIRAEALQILTTTPSTVRIEGATVVGKPDDYITLDFGGGTYQTSRGRVTLPPNRVVLPIAGFGKLAEVDFLPLAAPQLTIGTILGTQATFRYFPAAEVLPELGELHYFGFGIQHNPMVWFRSARLPFNIAAGYYTQKITFEDLFKVQTTAYGINLSKRLGFGFLNLTPYAGYMIEDAQMEVNYDYVVQTPVGEQMHRIRFDLKSENKNRITVGLSLRLLIINLNVDYNFAKYNSATAGVNFIL
ncbi:MAG: hypothetical protein ONB23_13065 [candidate division KSB1 bacterium]|nr:hypothetical protein [candidate division KSB1 bacterium]